jgi:hypothetical protein
MWLRNMRSWFDACKATGENNRLRRFACKGRRIRPRLEMLEDRTVPSGLNPSTTTLAASPASSIFGQPVELTATVSGKAGTPTGSVLFVEDNGTLLGTGTLSNGSATIYTTALPVGSDSLTAVYLGEAGTYSGSTFSAVSPFTVNAGAVLSTTTLSFGGVGAGSSSSLTVSLSDPTSSTTLTSLGITGPNAADFTLSSGPTLPFLLSNEPVTYTVIYKPTQPGPESATLTFATSVGTQVVSQAVALSGFDVPQKPIANAGGPYAMDPGTSLTLNASTSVPTNASFDNLSYSWTINNHADAATGVQPTLSWTQLEALGIGLGTGGSAALFSVKVTVTDSNGNTVTSSPANLLVGLPVAGIGLSATPNVNNTVGEAMSFSLTGEASVPAIQAAGFTFDIDWGDGTTQTVSGQNLMTVTHDFNAAGPATVTATAIDSQGIASLASAPINLEINQSPAQEVDLKTTPHQVLTNTLAVTPAAPTASKSYQFDLNQGDYLAITVAGNTKSPLTGSTLVVTDPNGAPVTPQTGTSGGSTSDPVFGFTAALTGTYSIKLSTDMAAPTTSEQLGYTMDLHRLALAQGTQNPAALQQSGSMFAFLVGDALNITGPTGYGFSIGGHWTQSVKKNASLKGSVGGASGQYSVYTATGPLTVNTALGSVPLLLPTDGSLVVTTEANAFGAEFGAVSSIQGNLNFSLSNYLSQFTTTLGEFGFKINSASLLSVGWSIEMGSQIEQQQQIKQVLGGVPYLFIDAQAGLSGTFGGISISNTAISKISQYIPSLKVVIDPSDPSLYLSLPSVAGYQLPISQLALSLNGRIPYVPTYAPTAGSGLTVTTTVSNGSLATVAIDKPGSGYPASTTFDATVKEAGASSAVIAVTTNSSGVPTSVALTSTTGADYTAASGLTTTSLTQGLTQFFGQIFLNGSIQIPIDGIPLTVAGNVTANLDVNNTGQFLDGAANAGQLVSNTLADASTILHDVDIGVNGTVSISYPPSSDTSSTGGFKFSVPLGGASAVYNGPLGGVWFEAIGGPNPLAGTPFSSLVFANRIPSKAPFSTTASSSLHSPTPCQSVQAPSSSRSR